MTADIDYEKCNRCRRCYELCPLDIIAWDNEKNRPYIKYPDECQLCFICQTECSTKAIKVKVPLAFW